MRAKNEKEEEQEQEQELEAEAEAEADRSSIIQRRKTGKTWRQIR